MSKITNPTTEGSVTCGFYNSLNDRKYDAIQMSSLFDGLIADGVFATVGDAFTVEAGSGNTVMVGTGRAWFNHTWTLNDAILPVECSTAEALLDRIDAIVIEVNATNSVRDNFIKFIEGTPSDSPSKPTLTNTEYVHQHPLCYIYRPAGSTEITNGKITNAMSIGDTPYVTGIIDTIDPDKLLVQWADRLTEFMASEEADIDEFMTSQETDFNTWYNEMKQMMSDVTNELNTWTDSQKSYILTWFDNMKDQLSEDAAANLQLQIDDDELERILACGLINGVKTFSDDGTVIRTSDYQHTERTLITTFYNDFSSSMTTLYNVDDVELGSLIKLYSTDGTCASVRTSQSTTIPEYAFSGYGSIGETSLPDCITHIGQLAFMNCRNLVLSTLPSGIVQIGQEAFAGCTSLKSITFKGTPTTISPDAFDGCTNLATINVPWSADAVANAPWGADNATINYDYTN